MAFRILLLLLISCASFGQSYNYQGITYTYVPTDSTGRIWEKSYPYKSTYTLDSAGKRLIIPRLQVVQTTKTQKDLLSDKILATSYDTVITVSGRDTISLVAPYVLTKDIDVRAIYGSDGIAGLIVFGTLFVHYPVKAKYIRLLELSKIFP